MAAEIAPLGFEIDTAALVSAGKAADATAKSLDGMGASAEKANTKTKQVGEEAKKTTDALKKTGEEAKKTGESFEKTGKGAAAAGLNVKQLMELLKQTQGHAAGSGQAIQNLTNQLGTMAQTIGQGGTGGLSGGLTNSIGLFGRLATTLGPVGGVLAGVAGGAAALGGAFMAVVTTTASVQERFALLEARLKNVYGSANTAKNVFADITVLANKNAVAIDQTAEAYLRLARNNQAIGLSRKQMVELTDTVQMLGRVSGASTGELASGMMQFSQALASGRLNGDELRSIMENMPALAKAIADGMKISVGQLRAMGAEGQLTGDKITKALLGQLPEIQKEFEALPQTSEQAFTRVGNAWDVMLDRIGRKINSSGVLQWVAKAAEDIIKATDTAVSGETSQQIIDRNRAIMNSPNWDQGTRDAAAREVRNQQYQAWSNGQAGRAARELDLMGEQSREPSARWEQGKRVLDDIDPVQRRVKELTQNLAQLKQMWADFQNNPKLLPEGAEEQAKRLPEYIAQLNAQLANALPAFDKFKKATADRIADAIKYGYQAQGFAADVRRLTDTGVGESAAVGAVTQDRVLSTNAETDAINKQIEAQIKRTAAIGQGRAAEREAEASAKALEYQLRTFGTTVSGDAKAAVDAYKASLLALSGAQDMAANKQAMLNAQIDLSAAKAGAAAAAAGGGAGAVAEAQRNARRAGQLATSDDPASMAVRFAAEDIDRRTGEMAQLRRVRADAAMQRGIAGGMSPAAARRAQQEQEARQFSEGFSDAGSRAEAYQAKISELRARDAASARQQLETRKASIDLMERETELTKTGSLEERVQLARARELNAIRQEGLSLSQKELDARLAIAEAEERAQDGLKKAQDAAARYKQMWDEIGSAVANSLDTAFSKMLDGQKVKFKDFLKDLMKDLAMILIKSQITGPLATSISSAGQSLATGLLSSAHGNVFSGGRMMMYAAGGIVASPTIFPMARGAGLMGEAGPEAVLPLKRGPDGRLGVAGGGASNDNGTQVIVNDMRSGGEKVQTEEERGPDGKRFIRLTIRDEVKGQIKSGAYDPEMRSQYGAGRVLARR